ncbi:MAG: MAPEG family protein [Pseudomonadota bacterium]
MLEYSASLLVLIITVAMVVLQSVIAAIAHRKQATMIPGILDQSLDHHSFVFRSHRTFHNSLENVPLFVLTALLSIALQVSAATVFWSVFVFFIARVFHMVLFYSIATNKNPSPRSYFYIIGLVSQLYLAGVATGTALMQ